jgi:hypothetical protein
MVKTQHTSSNAAEGSCGGFGPAAGSTLVDVVPVGTSEEFKLFAATPSGIGGCGLILIVGPRTGGDIATSQ